MLILKEIIEVWRFQELRDRKQLLISETKGGNVRDFLVTETKLGK